jgi:hypothetical protein
MQKLNLKSIYMFCRNCSFSYIDHNKIGFTKTIWLNPLLLDFLQFSNTKWSKLWIPKLLSKLPSTKMPKALGGFTHWFEQERQCKLTKFSAPRNSAPMPVFAFFTPFHSKLAMPIFKKVVCLAKLHIFPIGWFLKCLEEFWRTCQSSRITQRGQRGN